ncbi:MAG: hypothetical protein HY744_20810 [Deltaproteobacteria bacterium]|nr:hypothetical protein [Deltaproteobacteria bacterium]
MDLFEVFLKPGVTNKPVLSDEVMRETGAQIMTPAQAEFVGLEGIPPDPQGRERRLVACRRADRRLIQTRLESNEAVSGFRLHELPDG